MKFPFLILPGILKIVLLLYKLILTKYVPCTLVMLKLFLLYFAFYLKQQYHKGKSLTMGKQHNKIRDNLNQS